MTRAMTDDQVLPGAERCRRDSGRTLRVDVGRHSDTYVQCARFLEDPALTTRLAEELAERLGDDRVRPGGRTCGRRDHHRLRCCSGAGGQVHLQ